MRKRKCIGERERAFERQQEDTEKEMKRRLGGKKQTSSFLPQNPWHSVNLTSLNNQVSSKNNLSCAAANGSGSSNERLLTKKWKEGKKNSSLRLWWWETAPARSFMCPLCLGHNINLDKGGFCAHPMNHGRKWPNTFKCQCCGDTSLSVGKIKVCCHWNVGNVSLETSTAEPAST